MTGLEKKGIRKEVKGKIKKKEARQKGDELTALEGKEEELTGKLQQKYGDARERSKLKKKIEEA